MQRRSFIKQTSALLGAAALPLSCMQALTHPKYKMGYQLYSIRDEMAKDPIATLQALKAMGYQDFEIYGFDAIKQTIYGYAPSELKQILDDLEVTANSGHYWFAPYLDKSGEELKRFVDQCIKCAHGLSGKYITWPKITTEQRTIDNFKKMSQKLNLIGEQVKAAGLGFAYHNNGFEFDDHDGETGFDILMAETDPDLVKLEMDMYWVMHSSKFTPTELIRNQPGRYTMWHIKDMDKVTRDYTELGNGSINYLDLLPDPELSGLAYYYIEQGGNYAVSSMKSAEASALYFKRQLQKNL